MIKYKLMVSIVRLSLACLSLLSGATSNSYAAQMPVMLANEKMQIITTELKEDLFLSEGDIIISENKPSAVVVTKVGGTRWPSATVPFQIDNMMPIDNRLSIYRAMLEISVKTKVKFQEVFNKNKVKDYLNFVPSDSTICASHVGKAGGAQKVVLASRCKKGSTIHEILHALGLWHEQSRADREQYIQILWHNIKDDKKYNFSQHLNNGLDIGESFPITK